MLGFLQILSILFHKLLPINKILLCFFRILYLHHFNSLLAPFMAVRCAIRDCRKTKTDDKIIPRNKKLREFYDKKRDEGKPFKVAIVACINKLSHWIFALLKNRTTYQDLA